MLENRVNALDWLRAVAVGAVVIGHARLDWAPGGAVGVSVFFVLSGYFICSILMRDEMLKGPNVLKFVLRRVGRIYPMYIVYIAAVSLFLFFTDQEKWISLKPWLFDLLTFKAVAGVWVGYSIGVLWTLTVEIWFYLSFPFVLLAIVSFPSNATLHRRLLTGFAIVACGSLAANIIPHTGITPGYYDHFLLGAVAAVVAKSDAIRYFGRPPTMTIGFLIIFIMVLVPYPGARDMQWHMQSLIAGFGASIVILASIARSPLYQLAPIAFIGRISFSIYLVHALLLDVMSRQIESWYGLPVYLSSVIAISALTYRFVEKPANAFVHRHVRFDDRKVSPAFP
ncbi:acyltransferase family protein [Rhizobium leguminosarum]